MTGEETYPGAYKSIDGLQYIDKVVNVDQEPIGRTPRSNPATYTKLFDDIRSLFAETEEARARGFDKGRFSFNVPGGRCESAKGPASSGSRWTSCRTSTSNATDAMANAITKKP